MRYAKFAALCAASSLFAAMSAFAASSDYYLKIGDIKGESTERAAQSTPALSSFSWGASQSGSSRANSSGGAGKVSMQDMSVTSAAAPRDAASGLPTGKRQHKPVTMTTENQADAASGADAVRSFSFSMPVADNATTQSLDRACAKGNHIEQAELGGNGQRYKLRDVIVSSCTVAGNERKYELRGHVTLIK